jgi:hypothetical protein
MIKAAKVEGMLLKGHEMVVLQLLRKENNILKCKA